MCGKIRSLNRPPGDKLRRDEVLARAETLCHSFLHMAIYILRQKKDERSKKIPSVISRINVQFCKCLCLYCSMGELTVDECHSRSLQFSSTVYFFIDTLYIIGRTY